MITRIWHLLHFLVAIITYFSSNILSWHSSSVVSYCCSDVWYPFQRDRSLRRQVTWVERRSWKIYTFTYLPTCVSWWGNNICNTSRRDSDRFEYNMPQEFIYHGGAFILYTIATIWMAIGIKDRHFDTYKLYFYSTVSGYQIFSLDYLIHNSYFPSQQNSPPSSIHRTSFVHKFSYWMIPRTSIHSINMCACNKRSVTVLA